MAVDFRVKPHSVLPGVNIVEILIDGEMAGSVYPMGEKGIKLVSAHMEETEIDENFAGEVVEDDGSQGWPPIPAILVQFNPRSYRIVDNKIVREPQ